MKRFFSTPGQFRHWYILLPGVALFFGGIIYLFVRSSEFVFFDWLKVAVLVVGYELLQYPGVIPGTFSMLDIVFGLAGLTVGIIITYKLTKTLNDEKKVI